MAEDKEYSPTLIEWDELVGLWNRSRSLFASTIATNARARVAWTTKAFIERFPHASYRAVYAWLERNLEIARGSQPVADRLPGTRHHEEITAVHRRTPYGRIKIDDANATPPVAPGPGVRR